jgi:hypothetical protein
VFTGLEKKRTKQRGDGAWHSPAGVAEATTEEDNPNEENDKSERVYSWQNTDWGFAVSAVPLF